ncbi:MAG TPA: hypothetical protein VFS16_13825, partial [Acidimicrobiia bacterium]|nr:hypothetical protein [Acidimicrobiia bacterium]
MTAMRRRSLRRQWNAAFAAMLALSLGVGLAGTAGVYVLAEQTRDGADEVHRELMLLSELRNALTTEERLAHEYLNGPYAAGSFQDADDATGAILREMRSAFVDADELTETGIIEIQGDEAFASFRVPGGPDRT